MEQLDDYGARTGFWRMQRLLTRPRLPVTVFALATGLARSPEQRRAMQAAGWEMASRGLNWVEHRDMPEAEERAAIAEAMRLHGEVTGSRPRGWFTGRCSMNTVRLVAEAGGFDWISDARDDDLPHWLRLGGRDQLVLPYTPDANDTRFATAQGFNTGEPVFAYLRDAFDALWEEGAAGAAKMMPVGLHRRLVGRPGPIPGLHRFLDYALAKGGVWCARRADIAAHRARAHPPQPRERPSAMDRAAFVARLGGIFEHAPWIAERAHALQLGPAHGGALGMHTALVRVFRSAGADKRPGVLRAHADLAGRLAAAPRLTAASTAEQASAGLDALTDAERAEFKRLDAARSARHGFPFIIAVRDHDKAGILATFRRRLANDNATQFAEACAQVERIAELCLKAILP